MWARLLVGLLAVCAGGQTLNEWLLGVASRQLEARRAEVARIETRAQAEARARYVRETLLRFMGGLPEERTPLNLRRTGTIDRGDYRIEKLIYESQPQFYVTANLYVPQNGRGPFPAVLQPTGHSTAAKSRAFYQTLALGLVKSGFVVLTYDPLGQGERRLFYDPDLRDSKVGGTTTEHNMVGVQSLLAGESLARYMVWDGMRGIDVLESLPEVNAKRIGVAGCSGGGTLTAYLAAIDPRVQAAAPACYITAWEEQLPGTGPQDAEQQFPDQLKAGINHPDFAIAFAPRPYLQVNTEEDYFPLAGARRTFEESRRIYGLYGAADRIGWAVGPGPHGMPKVVREAIYGWMNRWLKEGGKAGPLPEPVFQTEYEQDLYCTPTGQVSTSLGGETAGTMNMRRFARKRAGTPDAARIARLTRYERGSSVSRQGAREWTLTLAGGRQVQAVMAAPQTPRGKTVLALGAGADLDELVRLGHPVLSIDMEASDKQAWMALMTGKPLVGMGIENILAALDALQQPEVIGFARGIAGVELLHAAALDKRLSEVIVEGSITSYEDIARTPIHKGILRAVVPGILGEYDLPGLAAMILPRPVSLVNLRLPAGETALLAHVRERYTAPGLTIRLRREGEPLAEAYPQLKF